jgi:carboxyl-terminal processing protease
MKKSSFFIGLASGMVILLLAQIALGGFFSIGKIAQEVIPQYTNQEYESFETKVEDVIGKLNTYYYEDIEEEQLYEEAIRGLVDSVGDPYTTYFTQTEYASFMETMGGSYDGIGVVVSYGETEDEVVVVAPFKGSPGEKAGIKPNDQIIAVDAVDINGMALDKIVELIKGPKGTDVVLTVIRDEETLDIPITREEIEVPTVEYSMKEDDIGYVAVSSFDLVTEEQFNNAIEELNKQGQKGMIIDLRFNPGGYLHIAYNMIDELLKEDMLVVYTVDKQGRRSELVTETKEAFDKPLVILVNGSSASASEIMSGAIKDHELGTIVGETTFGKGLVQQTIDLDDNSAIKVTVSRYYTPDGNYIQDIGVEPDVFVEEDYEDDVDDQLEKALELIREQIKNER